MIENSPVTNQPVSTDELEFAVFCIENLGVYLKRSTKEIYKLLTNDENILDNYIIYGYDSLHTQGKEYILDDIVDIMRRKGMEV